MGDEQSPRRPDEPKPFGFHELARRMSNWTGNFIATCLVLVCAIGFGRQMMEWSADPLLSEAAVPHPNDFALEMGVPDSFDILEFGATRDTFHRQSFQGDQKRALEQLRDLTRGATLSATLPTKPISPAEQKLIDQIRHSAPAETLPNGRLLYVVPGPLPTWIGALRPKPVATALEEKTTAEKSAAALDSPLRLVTWGMAVPANKSSWSLYVFILGAMSGATPADDGVPIPPGATRSMGVQGKSGAKMVGFSGKGEPEEWCGFFDRESAARGWRSAKGWREAGDGWISTFHRQMGEGAGEQSMNVRFSLGSNGIYYGMINLSSVRASGKGGSRP